MQQLQKSATVNQQQNNNEAKKVTSATSPTCILTNMHCCMLQCVLAEAAAALLHDHQVLVLFVMHTHHAINKVFVLLAMIGSTMTPAQDKKKAEADRQKELNDLFAIAIKQPKVPPGEDTLLCAHLADRLLTTSFHN